MDETGPWRLVRQVEAWVRATEWCSWLELAGSLGRGAGDELSDLDAGVGISGGGSVEAVREAVLGFAPVADALVEPLGEHRHLIVQYADGRQLSLVVMPADGRSGLPPGAVALVDKHGQLARPLEPASLRADADILRAWAFQAWWSLRDAVKHAGRGSVWRAITSLEESRAHAWRLHAAALGVDYPTFGAVSVENARLGPPAGLAATLPTAATPVELTRAARALAGVLTPLTAAHDVAGIRAAALGLAATAETRPPAIM